MTISPDEIRLLRERLDLTQMQFAQMLGVHPMTVSKWERGTAAPTPYNIQQMNLLEQGSSEMEEGDRAKFASLVAMGLFVAALAFVIALAVNKMSEAWARRPRS